MSSSGWHDEFSDRRRPSSGRPARSPAVGKPAPEGVLTGTWEVSALGSRKGARAGSTPSTPPRCGTSLMAPKAPPAAGPPARSPTAPTSSATCWTPSRSAARPRSRPRTRNCSPPTTEPWASPAAWPSAPKRRRRQTQGKAQLTTSGTRPDGQSSHRPAGRLEGRDRPQRANGYGWRSWSPLLADWSSAVCRTWRCWRCVARSSESDACSRVSRALSASGSTRRISSSLRWVAA